MKVIDLSKNIEYLKSDPWFMRIKVKHKPHKQSKWLIRFLGLPFKLFPKNFEGWADDTIQNMGVHSATHIDAPWHYSPTTNGIKAKSIDEIPLDWCFSKAVVIDVTHKRDFEAITAQEIEDFAAANKLDIEEKTIVLIRTGRDKQFNEKNL